MDFFEKVKREVKSQNTTIEGLLEKAFSGQVSRDVYNGWRRRNLLPRADDAVRIAKALNTSVEYLITGETEGKSSARVTIERYLDRFSDAELVRIQSILETVFPEKEDDTQQGQKKGGKLQDHSA